MRFDKREVKQLTAALRRARSPLSRSALGAALSEHARARTQRDQEGRLRAELERHGSRRSRILFVDHIGPEEVEELADALDPQV